MGGLVLTFALFMEFTLISSELNLSVKISAQLSQFAERLNVLESRDRNQQRKIEQLEELVIQQQADINKLKLDIAEKDRKVLNVRKRSVRTPSARAWSKRSGRSDADAINDSSGQNDWSNHRRRRDIPANIAFSAGLSHTLTHLGLDQPIVFDHVETNIGDGYNNHHGVFVAPVAGTYVFFASVVSTQGNQSQCYITVNGVYKATAHAPGSSSNVSQGSQMIVVHLQQGDDVAVQGKLTSNAVYSDKYFFSTFSGFMLPQVNIESIVG